MSVALNCMQPHCTELYATCVMKCGINQHVVLGNQFHVVNIIISHSYIEVAHSNAFHDMLLAKQQHFVDMCRVRADNTSLCFCHKANCNTLKVN